MGSIVYNKSEYHTEGVTHSMVYLYFNNYISKSFQIDHHKYNGDKTFMEEKKYILNKYNEPNFLLITKIDSSAYYGIVKKPELKILNSDKTISVLGYLCNEIILLDEAGTPQQKIYVTDQIQYPIGPMKHLGLSKAILKIIKIDTNETLFEAIKVSEEDVSSILESFPDTSRMISISSVLANF